MKFAGFKVCNHRRKTPMFVVIMEGSDIVGDLIVSKQRLGGTGVFRKDVIHFSQDFDSSVGDIIQIADWCRHQVQH